MSLGGRTVKQNKIYVFAFQGGLILDAMVGRMGPGKRHECRTWLVLVDRLRALPAQLNTCSCI